MVNNSVNHPEHYNKGNIEVITIMEDQLTTEEYIGYLKANVLKYILRFQYKNGLEDLLKAQWYLDRLTKFYSKTVENPVDGGQCHD